MVASANEIAELGNWSRSRSNTRGDLQGVLGDSVIHEFVAFYKLTGVRTDDDRPRHRTESVPLQDTSPTGYAASGA